MESGLGTRHHIHFVGKGCGQNISDQGAGQASCMLKLQLYIA